MAYEPGITQKELAEEFGVAESTVKEYGDRLKKNVNAFFHQHFKNAAEAAVFVSKEGLL